MPEAALDRKRLLQKDLLRKTFDSKFALQEQGRNVCAQTLQFSKDPWPREAKATTLDNSRDFSYSSKAFY